MQGWWDCTRGVRTLSFQGTRTIADCIGPVKTAGRRIDMRSDTATKLIKGAFDAMCYAEVGDASLGECPSTTQLEAEVASLLGKPSGIFLPTATMANQG